MNALRTALESIIDYAGLFPPAKLDMEPMVENYDRYRRSENAWMLGRVIVPLSRLDHFLAAAEPYFDTVDPDDPWRISALPHPVDDEEAFAADLRVIRAFNSDETRPVIIDALEAKAHSAEAIDRALDRIPDEIEPAFELPLDDDVRGMLAAMAGLDAIAKVRTGGGTADLFPSPHALSRFIATCVAAEVPFKATAGLHHPIRHPSRNVTGATEHGFFNLLFATGLIMNGAISSDEMIEALEETNAAAFEISEDRMAWRGHSMSLDEIASLRLNGLRSYGSCSFEEPLDDLRSLRLI